MKRVGECSNSLTFSTASNCGDVNSCKVCNITLWDVLEYPQSGRIANFGVCVKRYGYGCCWYTDLDLDRNQSFTLWRHCWRNFEEKGIKKNMERITSELIKDHKGLWTSDPSSPKETRSLSL